MNETEKFFEDLGLKQDSSLDTPLEVPVESSEKEEEGEESPKNRRERRLMRRLEQRGTETSQLAEEVVKLRNVVESQTLRTDKAADYLKKVEKLFGNSTPEGKEATELLKEVLREVHESARNEAKQDMLAEVESRESNESEAVKAEERNLDEIMDNIEDDYDIDFSNETDKQGFLTLLEKVSPKDRDGNIIEYADPDTTAELYLSRKERSSDRAKELASRSMTRSGQSQPSKLEDDATVRYLKEIGLI